MGIFVWIWVRCNGDLVKGIVRDTTTVFDDVPTRLKHIKSGREYLRLSTFTEF